MTTQLRWVNGRSQQMWRSNVAVPAVGDLPPVVAEVGVGAPALLDAPPEYAGSFGKLGSVILKVALARSASTSMSRVPRLPKAEMPRATTTTATTNLKLDLKLKVSKSK